jgi:NNP family nitrate/nitrite transporter-like MFS transporter
MRGRILVQATLLILEGACILVFAEMGNLPASVVMLTIFSIFVQGAEGSTYGIVPYVNRASPGAVAGIVGAGGPTGAVCFGLIFRYAQPFLPGPSWDSLSPCAVLIYVPTSLSCLQVVAR